MTGVPRTITPASQARGAPADWPRGTQGDAACRAGCQRHGVTRHDARRPFEAAPLRCATSSGRDPQPSGPLIRRKTGGSRGLRFAAPLSLRYATAALRPCRSVHRHPPRSRQARHADDETRISLRGQSDVTRRAPPLRRSAHEARRPFVAAWLTPGATSGRDPLPGRTAGASGLVGSGPDETAAPVASPPRPPAPAPAPSRTPRGQCDSRRNVSRTLRNSRPATHPHRSRPAAQLAPSGRSPTTGRLQHANHNHQDNTPLPPLAVPLADPGEARRNETRRTALGIGREPTGSQPETEPPGDRAPSSSETGSRPTSLASAYTRTPLHQG